MMKIYQLVFQSDSFQALDSTDANIRLLDFMLYGKSRLEVWPEKLSATIAESKRPEGIFLQWSASDFVLTSQAECDEVLIKLLENDGEFLPVFVDGELRRLHNITRFYECVDQERSKWGITIGDVPGRIEKPRFIKDAVPLGIQFRLREFPVPRYVATDVSLPPEKDFYQWYHLRGYKGIKFRLLWDSDKPDELTSFY